MPLTTLDGGEHGRIAIWHCSDWSGTAVVQWWEPQESLGASRHSTPLPAVKRTAEIPGKLLVALGREAAVQIARDRMVSAAEDLFVDHPELKEVKG